MLVSSEYEQMLQMRYQQETVALFIFSDGEKIMEEAQSESLLIKQCLLKKGNVYTTDMKNTDTCISSLLFSSVISINGCLNVSQ